MKQLFLTLLTVAGFAAVAPQAQAGQFTRICTDRGVIYAHKADVYGYGYTQAVQRNQQRQRYLRSLACRPVYPVYYRESCGRPVYYRPVPVRSCETYRAPRFAFSFGF
jgi:hypothetical protein